MDWKDAFAYNPETGDLIWKERPISSFADPARGKIWNKRFAGKVAGHNRLWKGRPWRVELHLGRLTTGAHRVVWQIIHGPIAKGMEIDHIDGNPWNNRSQNLRLCTRSQNNANRRRVRSGLKGVRLHKGRYLAGLSLNNKNISLGSYGTEQEAHEAYKAGAVKYYGEFARFE